MLVATWAVSWVVAVGAVDVAVALRVVVVVGPPVITIPVGVVRLFRAVAMIPGVTVLVDLVMAASFVG